MQMKHLHAPQATLTALSFSKHAPMPTGCLSSRSQRSCQHIKVLWQLHQVGEHKCLQMCRRRSHCNNCNDTLPDNFVHADMSKLFHTPHTCWRKCLMPKTMSYCNCGCFSVNIELADHTNTWQASCLGAHAFVMCFESRVLNVLACKPKTEAAAKRSSLPPL